jgi:hypothetical protein
VRFAFQLPGDGIASVRPPPLLAEVVTLLPEPWRQRGETVLRLAEGHPGQRLYCGGHWQVVTGLDDLREGSDLDLLWAVPALLVRIDGLPGPRLDGEVVLAGVGAVNWRELAGDADELRRLSGCVGGVLEPLLDRHALCVAIENGSDSFVVGGTGAALDAGVREAADAFAVVLRRERPGMLADGIRLLGGIDAEPVRDPEEGLGRLAGKIAQTIDWAGCLRACIQAGATRFLDLGPGSALARMAGGLAEQPAARSIEDFRSATGVADWLARDD